MLEDEPPCRPLRGPHAGCGLAHPDATTPATVLALSAVTGSLRLATVLPTSGLMGHLRGLRDLGRFCGIVPPSHHRGAFTGVRLGGALHDAFGRRAP